jgi:hypothetical protein
MAVTSAVLGTPVHRVGIGQLQQVDLLSADVQPGAGKTQRGPRRLGQAEDVAVKTQGTAVSATSRLT